MAGLVRKIIKNNPNAALSEISRILVANSSEFVSLSLNQLFQTIFDDETPIVQDSSSPTGTIPEIKSNSELDSI